ncbi:MAG: TlpA disulfide reductase family protein [Alphaproteobacteria bacterium]
MKKIVILALLLGGLAVVSLPLLDEQPAPPPSAAPDFAYTAIDGHGGRLHDLKGKIVLLHFWASWCAPCAAEFPGLLDFTATRRDITVLAVTVDAERAAAEKFLADIPAKRGGNGMPANFLVIHDPEKKIAQDIFQTFGYPETILIAPDMTMRGKIVGPADWKDAAMQAKLAALTHERP